MMMPSRSPGPIRALTDALLARIALIRKAGTFALIGIINTAINYSVLMAAYELLHLPLVPANVLAWIIAVSGSYVLNSFVTFAAESGRKLTLRAYATFVASGVLGLIGDTTTLWVASHYAPVWAAKIPAIGVAFLINFSMSHFVVFRSRPTEDGGRTTEERPVA
jgi:putative flippase GtrA